MFDHWANTVLSLVAVFVSGGMGAAVFNAASEGLIRRRRERQSVRYLAVQLAHALEQYALETCELIAKDDTYEDAGGHAGERIPGLPKFPPLPSDDAYRQLDLSLFDEILSVTHKERLAQRNAQFWFDVNGEEDVIRGSYRFDALDAAVQAFSTARKLRRRYGFPVNKEVGKSEFHWREKYEKWVRARQEGEEKGRNQESPSLA